MESTSPKKRFIETSSFYTNCATEDPFSGMKIDDCSFLDKVPSRSKCPKCNKSRKYYCYTCYVAVEEVAKRLPVVTLPVHVDIIKHPKEVDGKSTAAHAAILAPHHVTIHTFPNVPTYEDGEAVLIFPGPNAVPLEELCREGQFPYNRVVFIDSTWRQANALYSDPRLKSLPCASLSCARSVFWRHQRGKPESHLATVEAVYYAVRALFQTPYDGQIDNLLFFFRHTYKKLRDIYHPPTS